MIISSKITFISLFIYFLNLASLFAQKTQDTIVYVNLTSINPNADESDLQRLDTYFENVKVIAMGESTHGTSEFTRLRFKMFKYLVENHQFNTFFLEADYANCLRINNYINGENDTLLNAIREIELWPWQTTEMGTIIDWMRTYNSINKNKLNFIGVDVQKFNMTLKKIDLLLKTYNLPVTDSLTYFKIMNTDFYSVSNEIELEVYNNLVNRKKNIETEKMSAKDHAEYSLLVRHFNQIIIDKRSKKDERDKMMAKNILHHLKSDSLIKGFFCAHNGHIYKKLYNKSKKEKKRQGPTGGFLAYELQEQYFSIAQEFNRGSFNAYYLDSLSQNKIKGKGYTLGKIKVEPAIPGSFSYQYRDIEKPIFIDCTTLQKKESVTMSLIGAVYYPSKIFRNNHHGRDAFHAIILIDKSTPTHLLKK